MQEENNEEFNELKEIRRKQYEESLLLRKRKSSKVKKNNSENENENDKNENIDNETKEEIVEETKSLLESDTKQTKEEENENDENNNEDTINNTNPSGIDLANERRKNRGFESKDSKLLHYLFVIYYNIKLFFNFIYMFFYTLISPEAGKKLSSKDKPKKFKSFDTYHKNNKTINAGYLGFGQCSQCS
ncbi:hypothetical protein BCR32DRAFT_325719 [Anaeromyces robustus]|uniref:Uncharacterized protein n=1 Tax=Anaeromyces robustus TaxID=1754192 RepID=A0A1Y1XGM0_9FUNG|nr:hypothetical protein BCR32DRAFT_325719 [Anaeromyces robustus]|eukprot:ORX84900.1 hypothetical protein BCR32DRAFT_325719 [Anaeromyces robustus]